jgi:hypothetical protein
MMNSPFVSKHLVPDGVRFYPLFSNFCEHFVSMNRQQNGFHNGTYFGGGTADLLSGHPYREGWPTGGEYRILYLFLEDLKRRKQAFATHSVA